MAKFSLIITFLICGFSNIFAQFEEVEKLYLHIDRRAYNPRDTIWLRGFLDNNILEKDSLSKFIYVELLRDSVFNRIKIKRGETGFIGQMALPNDIKPGNYILRAYTNWQMNFSPEYMFYTNIYINRPGAGANRFSEEKGEPIVSFYPESGRYFVGNKAVLALKAEYAEGSPAMLSGALVSDLNDTLQQISVNEFGMGKISFLRLENRKYFFRTDAIDGRIRSYPLPEAESEGASIAIAYKSQSFFVNSYINKPASDSIFVVLFKDGHKEFLTSFVASDEIKEKNIRIDESNLDSGIYYIVLMTNKLDILAQRAFYSFGSEKFVSNIEHSIKDNKLILIDKDFNSPIIGNYSISVLRNASITELQSDDIVSYMNIGSGYKGKLIDPKYFIDESVSKDRRFIKLDLFMLSQFLNNEEIGILLSTSHKINYPKEFEQSITSEILSSKNRQTRNYFVTCYAPKVNTYLTQEVIEGKRFRIEGLNFPENTQFVIGVKARNSEWSRRIGWVKEEFPKYYDYFTYYKRERTINSFIVSTEKKDDKQDYDPTVAWKSSIEAAKIQDDARSNLPRIIGPMGGVIQRSQYRTRSELEKDDIMSIPSYVAAFNAGIYNENEVLYGNKITSLNSILNSTDGGGRQQVLVVIDGMQTSWDFVASYSIRDVERLTVLKGIAGSIYNTVAGVVIIDLRKGDESRFVAASDVLKITPLGYTIPKKFSPNFRTIYWNPCVITDAAGQADLGIDLSEYIKKGNIVRIQGQTNTGEYFEKTIR